VTTAVWKQNTSSGSAIVYSFTDNISTGLASYTTVPSATGSGVMNADVAMSNGVIHIVWQDDNSGTVKYLKGTYAPASVAWLPERELISVYPNPASGTFSVHVNKAANLTYSYLSDNMGRHFDLQPTYKNGTATFQLSGIAKGMYYFVMGNEAGKTFYNKIVVE
jgi:hypothetical protein